MARRRRRKASSRRSGKGWLFLPPILAVSVLVGLALRPADLTVQVQRAGSITAEFLQARGIHLTRDLQKEMAERRQSGRRHWEFRLQQFSVPPQFSWNSFAPSLEKLLQAQGLRVLRKERQALHSSTVYEMDIGSASEPEAGILYRLILKQPQLAPAAVPAAPSVSLPPPAKVLPARSPSPFPKGKGKIAIVLDDWGYSLRNLPILESIRRPVTVAILPSLPHSAEVAKGARAHGHEVILHMPMQAMDPNEPVETGTLQPGMSETQVIQLLDQALASVPGAEGISNHQGSRATSDRALMEIVLRHVKQRKLYFLDSFVTGHSVCREVARAVQVPFAQRAVFLDNEENQPAIEKWLAELARQAARRGEAIGIGHDRPAMMEELRKAVPALEEAGYTLVPVSDLTD